MVEAGSPEIDDYRRFRQALRADADLAARYQRMKLALAAEYAHDRKRYVSHKAVWVDAVVASLRVGGARPLT